MTYPFAERLHFKVNDDSSSVLVHLNVQRFVLYLFSCTMNCTRNAKGLWRECRGSEAVDAVSFERAVMGTWGMIDREQDVSGWKQALLGASSRFHGDKQESGQDIRG